MVQAGQFFSLSLPPFPFFFWAAVGLSGAELARTPAPRRARFRLGGGLENVRFDL
jgi:hypothetical protein